MTTTYWKVSPEWAGQTVYIVGGGPSVADQDLSLLAGKRVITINASYQILPDADIAFFGDARFGRVHHEGLKAFAGRVATCSEAVNWPGLLKLRKISTIADLAEDPSCVVMGRTSLHAAMNLAFHLGVGKMVLLGADMSQAPDGRTHHHAPHIWPVKANCWREQMNTLKKIAPALTKRGVVVVNTSLNSLIDWWPKRPLQDCV